MAGNIYDQFDTVAEANPYDQFDDEEDLAAGLDPLEQARIRQAQPYYGSGQQPFDPMTGSALGPVSQAEKAEFSKDLLKGKPLLQIPGAIFQTGVEYGLVKPINWLQHQFATVPVSPPDQRRINLEDEAKQAAIERIRRESGLPPEQPVKPPTTYMTPAQAGVTAETPMLPMPPESEKGFWPAVQRNISPLTSSAGLAQFPFFELRPVRALAAMSTAAALPGTFERLITSKTGPEATEEATNLGIESLVTLGLTKSLKKKGVQNAIQPEDSELHAGVRARHEAEQGGAQVPAEEGGPPLGERGGKEQLPEKAQVLLKPEEQAYLDAEREGLGSDIHVSDEVPKGNTPFAGQVSTIDRANNRIIIRPGTFGKWLNDIRPEKRAAAVKSLLNEERIHLLVDDASALKYWNSLTAAEKLISGRRYSGQWSRTGRFSEMTDTNIGHEALRFRLQQLSGMTPREIAELTARQKEWWTVQTLTALEHVIRTTREKIGKGGTEASKAQRAIVDKMMANLDVAKGVVAAGGAPSAISKKQAKDYDKYPEPENRIRELAGLDAASFMKDVTSKEGGLTGDAWKLGLSLKSPDGVQMLRQAMQETSKKIDAAKASKDFNVWGQEGMRNQFFREAYEAATGTGSAAHHFRDDPTYRPPVPSETTPVAEPSAMRKQFEEGGERYLPYRSWVDAHEAGMENLLSAPYPSAAADKWQNFLEDLEASYPHYNKLYKSWHAGNEGAPERGPGLGPNAIRKKHLKQRGQEELFLPPILPEDKAKMERAGYDVPTATQMEKTAGAIFQRFKEGQGKIRQAPKAPGPPKTVGHLKYGVPLPRPEPSQVVPEFEDFKGAMESKHGAIGREQIWYLWKDALTKQLMEAKGGELTDELVSLGLKRDVAEAMRPNSRDPYIGKIPDIMTPEEMDNQIEYVRKMFSKKPWITMEEFKRKFGPEIGRKFSEPFQRRYAAIGAILDELTKRAGEQPKRGWDSKEIGPEDIMQGYAVENPLPKSEAQKIEEGEVPEAEMPTILSKKLIQPIPIDIIHDPKAVGDIVTQGAAVEASGKGAPPRTVSRNLMIARGPDGQIVMLSAWRDPRQGPKVTDPTAPTLPGRKIDKALLQKWEPIMAWTLREPRQKFFKRFRNQEEFDKWFGDVGIEGTTGLRTTSVIGPLADIYRAQVLEGKARIPEEETLPPAPGEFVSETSRELTARKRVPPTMIPGQPLPKGTAPEPAPIEARTEEMLSPEDRKYVEQMVKEESIPMPQLYEEISKVRQLKVKPGGKAYVTSRPQFITKSGLLGPKTRTEPSAFRKQELNDEMGQLFKQLRALGQRRVTKKDLPRILDGAERAGDQYARTAGEVIRLKSYGRAGQQKFFPDDPENRGSLAKEALQRRKAAKAMIASSGRVSTAENPLTPGEFSPNGLDFLRKDVQFSMNKAEGWMNSMNPVRRIWGKRWYKRGKLKLEEIEYARTHWDDPELQATASQILKEGKDEIDFENANGFNVNERDFYIPGRYEGEFWNADNVVFAPLVGAGKLLGEQFRGGKRFRDSYEAIRFGPYLEASLDPSYTMESRIHTGRRRAAQKQAFDLFKDIRDPATKKPIAKDPKEVPVTDEEGKTHMEYYQPSPEYKLAFPSEARRGKPIAVLDEYHNAVQSLTRTSQIVDIPGGKEALLAASMLKHGWMLIGDLFHASRLGQYAMSLTGSDPFKMGLPRYGGGYAVLNWREADLPEAVKKGFISQRSADWATERIPIRTHEGITRDFSRHQIGSALIKQGLNASRIIDALYKDAVKRIPLIGEPWHKVIGPYNRWLFDKFSSGLMLQSAVINFERLHQAFPDKPLHELTRDVVRDINIEFGNMGRQGIFKNPTFRDFAQIFLLAPMWREGIIRKELSTYGSLLKAAGYTAKGDLVNARYQLSRPVFRSMIRGIAGYFILTQVLNLITRKQLTFQNEEKDHKFDAYIPINKDEGFWLSPMSVFMEMTHRVNQLIGTKPRVHDAIMQIGEDALGPVGKAVHVLRTGEDEYGRRIETTPRIYGTAIKQLGPLPLSFGAPARAIGHRLAPELIRPNRPGALTRQMMGWAGAKVEPSKTVLQRVQKQADDYAEANNLEPESGFYLQPTDAESYHSLREAIRNDDRSEAESIFAVLRKKHPLVRDKKGNIIEDPILKAMGIWAQRPMTGSWDGEVQFVNSLSHRELELYSQAMQARTKMLEDYIKWYVKQPRE